MADTRSTPDAAGTSRSALLAEFDGGTWTPDDALVLWSFLANEAGAKALAHLFEFVKKNFLTAVATVMDGNDARERAALRLIVAGDYHQASNRFDEVFFVAPKDTRFAVLRRQAALLGPVIPSTATIALKAAADLSPGDRLSRWTLGLLLEQLGKLDEATGSLEQLLELELTAKRHSDAALTQVALARIAGKQGNKELDATRLREAAGLYYKEGEKAATDAAKHLERAATNPAARDEAVKVYEAAAKAFQSAVDLFTKLGDDIGTATALTDLAGTFAHRGLYAQAESHAERALDLYTAAGEEEASIRAIVWLGAARASRDIDAAHALFRRGLEIATRHGLKDAEQQFREMLSLGKTADSTGQASGPAQAAATPAATAPAAAQSQYPVNSREYFWDRILSRKLTAEDATALWKRLTVIARGDAEDLKDGMPETVIDWHGTRNDFVAVAVGLMPDASDLELGAIAMLSGELFDKAAKAYEQVVAAAGDQQALKLGHFGVLFAPSRPDIARKAFERMLKLNPGFNDARFCLGSVLERLEDFGAAAVQYQAVIRNSGDDPRAEAKALENLASLAERDDEWDDAHDYYERALKTHRRQNDAAGVGRVLHHLSDVAHERDDLTGTIDYLRQALEVAMESGDALSAQLAVLTFTELEGEHEFGQAAETALERSIEWFTKQKDVPCAADAAFLLGQAHVRRDQLEKAEHYYERSREVSQKNGHDAGTARAFGMLGMLRMNEKDYDHADWYFKTASKLFEDAGQERASTRMLARRGWNLCLKDDISEGRSQLSRALARYVNAGMHEEAKQLREKMAEFGLSA